MAFNSKPTFQGGLNRASRASWSGNRATPSTEQQLMGFYTGIVMDDSDDQRMGQIWVYVAGVSQRRRQQTGSLPVYGGTAPDRDNSTGSIRWDQTLRLGWIQAVPLLPFFGADDYRVQRSPGGDFRNAGNGDVNSYGFWAQPRIGDEVGLLFANGDPGKAYWIGMIPKYVRNFMVPGSPGRPPEDLDEKRDVQDEFNPNPAIHKLTKQIKEEAQQTVEDALVPAFDKARRLRSTRRTAQTNQGAGQEPESPVEKELESVLAVPEAAQNLQKAGMLCDVLRGASNSSMRRESPSYVMGFKSAGWNFDSEKGNLNTASERIQFRELGDRLETVNTPGHQFVMDDHPDYQGVRLRTSAGSQLYFNDTCNEPFVYINTAQGNVWIELVDNGQVNIFAEDSVSVHARNDINLTADRDINIDAQRDLNVQVRRDTNFTFKGRNDWEFGRNDLEPKDLKYEDSPDWGMNDPDGDDTRDTFIQSFGNMHVTVGSESQPERNLFAEVTNNVDWTIGNDLNIDVGNDTDILIGANLRLETTDDIDIESGGNTTMEQQGYLHMLTQQDGRWTADTHDHFSTGGDFVVTASPNVHLNGPQAATATSATNPNPVEDPELPDIPETTMVNRVPTDLEVLTCDEPPTEFETLDRMIVPQHQPWALRCTQSFGTRGIVDESAVDVARKGSTRDNATVALNLPEATGFKEAQPFQTANQEEKPVYDVGPPRGTFAPCSTYSTSEKGIDFLHRQEGIRTKAYKDTDKYAIGYGHNIKVGDTIFGDTINGRVTQDDIDRLRRTKGDLNISEEEARRLFKQDLVKFEQAVCRQVTTDITQGQFDALVSYAYNGGEGAVRRMVNRSNFNSGNFEQVPAAWMRLSTASGEKDPVRRARLEAGLRRRRRQELEELFAQA